VTEPLQSPARPRPLAKGPFIRLDRRSRETLQTQIYTAVRGAILDGTLAPGAVLPSSRALALELGVSRTTTLLAFEQLEAEGYLAARRGSGTFVARELPDDLPALGDPRPPTESRHPPLSRRGRALAAVPPAAVRAGPAVRPFRIGVPALDRFPIELWTSLVTSRLRSATMQQLDYGDPAGLPALRQAIADHVNRARGTACQADQVIVVAGAQRGLELVCRLLLDEGDAALLEDPGYPGARSALVSAGARIVPARVDGEGLDVEALTRQRSGARLLFVTPSHQFPLGVTLPLPRRLALLRWAARARAWIVEDDYDSEFRYGAHPIPCLHGLDTEGRVIYVGSFSKTLFPALRLGFVIVPSDLQEAVRAVQRASGHAPATADQAALTDLIARGHFDRHLRRMRSVYRERAEALAAAVARHARGALSLRPIQAGLHAVADLDGVGAGALFREAAARGVEVMPLSAYRLGRSRAENALVLGFGGVAPDGIARGMERLAGAIETLRRSRAGRRRRLA
jgi:GntR family transcriptional regulator / MocR family aminotransferase